MASLYSEVDKAPPQSGQRYLTFIFLYEGFILPSIKNVFVKIALKQNATPQEIAQVCSIIEKVDEHLPLVIQPIDITPIKPYCDIQMQALTRLADVRIIPQIHKYLGLR